MKNIILVITLFASINSISQMTQEHKEIQKVVVEFFGALSQLDEEKMKLHVTDDFLLIEHSEIMTIDSLFMLIKPMKNRNFKRENKLKFFETHNSGDMAWLAYKNSADFTVDGKQSSKSWIESAVLRRVGGKWKIQMLHSTPIVSKLKL